MRIKQPDSLSQTFVLLICLFIWLTTVTRSERPGDEELREIHFTNSITRTSSADVGNDIADARFPDGGEDDESGSYSTRFMMADGVQHARVDSHQMVIPLTSTRQPPHSTDQCLSLSSNAHFVTHTVTVLRISPQFSTSRSQAGPLTFSVDSTITILTIEINSSVIFGAGIWDPTGTLINKRWKREGQPPKPDDHNKNVQFTVHIQQPRIFHNRLNPGNSNHHVTSTRKGLNRFKGAWLGNHNRIHTNKPRRRAQRSVRLITLENADGSDVWEIDPPNIGLWSISIDGPEPAQIAVTAISSLDFTFEFLDIRTESSMTSQPIAYETTLVRLTMTSQPCVANVTMLNLLNDAGETISAIESNDVGLHLDQMASTGKGSILFWLQMPDVPFYMSATGYDVTGQRFQRLTSERVVPRMFALSFVNFRSDPLVPGTDYKFGVRLRNKGGSDVFKIVGAWDNSEYFKAVIAPSILKVEQNQIAHVAMVISVKASIYFIMKGALTVTACRLSDNVTDTLTESMTGEPASFLQDYESPACTTTSTTGGCRPNLPCQVQKWTSSILVSDSLTGVRSAVFLDPPLGAFNNVQFLYSMTNRTARAEYGYTCCNMEATLLAYDYAKNPSYCKLMAPVLDPQTATTLQYSQVASNYKNNLTSDSAFISPTTTPIRSHVTNRQSISSTSIEGSFSRWSQNASTIVSAHNVTILATLTENTGRTPDFQPSVSQTAAPTATSGQSLGRKTTPRKSLTSVTLLLYTVVAEKMSSQGSTNSSGLLAEGNRGNQHSVNGVGSSTLRLAAIVCGSLAGVAGLAIAVICVAFRCMVKHQRDRPWRRRSNDSDVTMGSSSETRSVGSYSADSLRMSRTDRSVESSSADSLRMSRTDRSVENCTADSLRISKTVSSVESSSAHSTRMSTIGRSSGKLTEIDSCRTTSKESGNSVSIDAGKPIPGGQKSLTLLNEFDTHHVGSRHFKEDGDKERNFSRRKGVHYSADFKNVKIPYLSREKAEDIMKTRLDAPKRDEAEVTNANSSSLQREKADSCTTALRAASSTRQEVEDVIFRCVVEEKSNATENGATEVSSDAARGVVSKQSYSPLLRSGGKTYSSMLQVQRQIEAMENQRRNLSSAASQYPPACTSPTAVIRRSDDAQDEIGVITARLHQYQEHCTVSSQYPPASTPPRVVIRRLNDRNEMGATTARLGQYQEGSSCNDGPPGSPHFKTYHVHAQIQSHTPIQNHAPIQNYAPVQNKAPVQSNSRSEIPEICHVRTPDQRIELPSTLGENQNQYNISTRRYLPGINISVPERERKCMQITSDDAGPYSKEDTPVDDRFQRESAMQQHCPNVGTKDPHMSPKTTPRTADGAKPSAEVAQHVDNNNLGCCDPHMRSRAVGRSNYRNLTSEGTSQRQYSESYNQTQAKPLRSRKHFKISQTAPRNDFNNTPIVPKKQPYRESGRIHSNKRHDHYYGNEYETPEKPSYQEQSKRFQNNKQPDHYPSNESITPENPAYPEERSRFENNKRPDHYSSNAFGTSQELTRHDEEDFSVQNRNRPHPSAVAERNQRYLDITNGSHPSPTQVPGANRTGAQSSQPNQVFVRVQGQIRRPKTLVYGNSRESTANIVTFDTYNNNEIGQEETSTPRVTMSSIPTPTQTPSNSRSESPDPRYLQPGNGSRIVSEANQMALRHDIEHIRQKLLKFQRRIDHEIEEESRRSGGNSPCPSDS